MRRETDDPILTARDDAELDAAVGERVARAGAREEPPAEELAAIRAAARETFRSVHRAPRSPLRRFGPAIAAAAALLVAAVGVRLWSRDGEPAGTVAGSPAIVGHVELLHGDARLEGASVALETGAPIGARATLVSGGEPGSGVAVRLASGGELRVDAATRVRFESPSRIRLERGALYFDSQLGDPVAAGRSFEIVAAAMRFRHVGTQFEVRVGAAGDGPAVRLRVREGRVGFGAGEEAVAGEEVVVDASGRIGRGAVSTHGAAWRWVVAAAPIPRTEGWDVVRFLDWLGRETGRSIEFADPQLRAEAAAARLHGGLAGLTPDQAAEVVLESAGLAARAADGVLRIEDATAPER